MASRKGRDRVHVNLNRARRGLRDSVTYAVADPGTKSGLTPQRNAAWVELRNAEPVVSESGRQKCLARARDNGSLGTDKPTGRAVHAWVWGSVTRSGSSEPDLSGLRKVRYNPFRAPDYRYSDTGEKWTGSARCIVHAGYVWTV